MQRTQTPDSLHRQHHCPLSRTDYLVSELRPASNVTKKIQLFVNSVSILK